MDNCEKYFPKSTDKWKNIYLNNINNINHDEKWLTLISLYSIFGNQKVFSPNNITAFNNLLACSGFGEIIDMDDIQKVLLEKSLPEIICYRKHVFGLLVKEKLHLYPDINSLLLKKYSHENIGIKSIEGNTNLDALVVFSHLGKEKYLFIESKFLSDIDIKTKYNPVRNQIIRNIDSMIEFVTTNKNSIKLEDVYFALLTPKIFRTKLYNGNKASVLDCFNPQKSRYFCYIMNEYKIPDNLRNDLPHRKLDIKDWETVSKHLGWITFEDIYSQALSLDTIDEMKNEIIEFFIERNLRIE